MKRQPIWPTYYGPPLPAALNPLNPYHHWLLFTWLFFQPSHLLHYLHQADPTLYFEMGWQAMRRTLTQPAYRNLYLTTLIFISVISFGLHQFLVYGLDQSFNLTNWALGMVIGVIYGVAYGVLYGVVIGVLGGVTLSMTLGLMLSVTEEAMLSVILGLILGIVLGATYSVSYGMGLGVIVGTALSGVVGVGLDTVVLNLALAMIASVTIGVAIGVIITALPLPYTLSSVKRQVPQGSHNLFTLPMQNLFANLFQRWMLQRVYSDWLKINSQALVWFYALTHDPRSREAVRPPIQLREFNRLPTVCLLLLGEIGQTFVGGEGIGRIAWYLTYPLRVTKPTPISQFSGLMFELLRDEEALTTMPVAEIRLAERYAPRYQGVRALPQGEEIATLYETLAQGLAVTTWAELVALPLSAQTWELPILPTQQQARLALSDVLALLRHYDQATNLNQRTLALNRANSMLKELSDYVTAEVQPPEQVLWLRLLEHWRDFVATQQGQLAQAALHALSPLARQAEGFSPQAALWQQPAAPFDNPYIAGRPVTPPLFVGRNDIYTKIAATWSAQSTPDSIILYGHRRMGKSSILRNIPLFIPLTGLFVYSDLSGDTSYVSSAADLILELASKLHYAAQQQGQILLEVKPSDYARAQDAQHHFNRLLEQVAGRVYFALDEFEAIDVAVAEGRMGAEIYGFLRSYAMGNTNRNLTFILGGLHTLEEMSQAYHQAFFGSYQNLLVSYLSPDTARTLITNPTEDFNLNYEPAAVARLIHETGGQPLLIQQLCREALNHLNHTIFDLGQTRPALITLADVEVSLAEILSPRGNTYFLGVWAQLTEDEPRHLIRALAQRDAPWTLPDIRHLSPLSEEQLLAHLTWATRHDLLRQATPHTWQFCVPLMRQWVARLE